MKKAALILTLMAASSAEANICGTDYQNFNPTSNGLDFVTVQSSETLKPCVINMGLFVNYAVNSLTYSRTLNATYQNGQKRKDRSLGADLSLGTGLTDRWDVGISVPIVLRQTVQDDHYVSSIDSAGVMEVRANSKFRLLGDERGGLAAIVSLNKNLVEDNPFAGRNPGLTWNYELAADTTLANNWAAGVNIGYRDRNPGSAIPGVPFVPMEDQWTYSVAGSYLISKIDTKLIAELYGSKAAKSVDQDTDRGLNALEGLLGVKHDYSQNLALHAGFTRQIDQSIGGAEWRAYVGLNWALGPVCGTPSVEVATNGSLPPSSASLASAPAPKEPVAQVLKLDVDMYFKFGSETAEPGFFAALEPYMKDIKQKGFEEISIEGHTDSVGPDDFNQYLSEKRAAFVREALIQKFNLSEERVKAVGFGSSRPIADNGNYQGRRKNRRVELVIMTKP